MKMKLLALLLALTMLLSLAACGGSAASAPTASGAETASEPETEAPADEEEVVDVDEEEETEAPDEAEASAEDEAVEAVDENDFTAANAAMDFTGYKEMLKGLTTELPITEEDVTLSYFFGFEGSLLYNFGFQKGSGHDVETWDFDADGEPLFDGAAIKQVAESTNIASGVISTKDLAGVVFDKRLSFEFEERELSCFDAWSTNKTTDGILGSKTVLTSEEATEASGMYSDILTYVATSALQFINGDKDVDGADWDEYVKNIEGMGIAELTEIIQGAYDRANA